MIKTPILAILVPCYNEQEVIQNTISCVNTLLDELIRDAKISPASFALYIDDGSSDKTWSIVAAQHSSKVQGLRFSKNFGHQAALMAGYAHAVNISDINISIDADLQHDISKIHEFVQKYQLGFDIVLGIKNHRGTESSIKRLLSLGFYRLMKVMGTNVHSNHADYRLLSKQVTQELLRFSETNLFLRGIIPQIGFPIAEIYYDVKDREGGVSKYSFRKMVSLAINGITSFSIRPLRVFSLLGILILFLSMGMTGFIFFEYMQGNVVPGWASTVIPIYFIGSIQVIGLGVIGEYIGKIYLETKSRPLYILREKLT